MTVRRPPSFVSPQLCTLVADPPEGDDWLHEVKFDGYRILCRLASHRATLWSWNEKDWTDRFPSVASEAARLPAETALLDGEVVVPLENGVTSFNALQNALTGQRDADLLYYVFDLLHLDGRDLTSEPLEKRRAALKRLLPARAKARVRLSESVQRPHLGALLIGVYEGGRLAFAGKVGTGFTYASARALRARLDALRRSESPFVPAPKGLADARWVEPRLVAVVRFTEWTPDEKLRHPSFQGLREDKDAREVVREEEDRR